MWPAVRPLALAALVLASAADPRVWAESNKRAREPNEIDPLTAEVVIGDRVTATVAPEYVSFNIDAIDPAHLSSVNLTDPVLLLLTAALTPAHLRVGGTQGDYNVYAFADFANFDCAAPPPPMTAYRCKLVTEADWRGLLAFVAATNTSLVYGLNDLFGRPTKTHPEVPLCNSATGCPPRNQSNLETLLRWTAANAPDAAIYGWELGNELNTCLNGDKGAKTQAEDFKALANLVADIWPNQRPKLVGPDTHSAAEFSQEGLEWFGEFVSTAGDAVDAFTFHMYSLGNGPEIDPAKLDASFLNATALNKSGEGGSALLEVLSAKADKGAILWAGETAAANDGGQSNVTDTYIDGFWYLDQLGSLAAEGVQVFQRQELFHSHGYPMIEGPKILSDYWVALLHKRLMGQRVLPAQSNESSVRVYTHCARGMPGAVALAWLNLRDSNATVTVSLGSAGPGALSYMETYRLWVLQPGSPLPDAINPLQSQQTLLNGHLLQLGGGAGTPTLPPLTGLRTSGPLVLPPKSYGFVVLDSANLAACMTN